MPTFRAATDGDVASIPQVRSLLPSCREIEVSVNAVIAPLNWVGGAVVLSEPLATVPAWRSVVSSQCPLARRQAICTCSPVTKPALDGDFEPSLQETVPF